MNGISHWNMQVSTKALLYCYVLIPYFLHWSDRFVFLLVDILVPITTFSYCCLGIALIVMSMRFFHVWRRSSRLHLDEILDQYYDGQKLFYNRYALRRLYT
jgi:hypothetical protein